jgi:KUP system potassium uptake protein
MESSIQFADDALHPAKSNYSHGIGGVMPLRQIRSHGRKSSIDAQKIRALEDDEDEDAGLRDERDYKTRQVCYSSESAR